MATTSFKAKTCLTLWYNDNMIKQLTLLLTVCVIISFLRFACHIIRYLNTVHIKLFKVHLFQVTNRSMKLKKNLKYYFEKTDQVLINFCNHGN